MVRPDATSMQMRLSDGPSMQVDLEAVMERNRRFPMQGNRIETSFLVWVRYGK